VTAPELQWTTAVHEAGHAVAARAMGYAVRRITIVPDDDSGGHCISTPFANSFDPDLANYDGRVRRRLEAQIIILCAGGVAQARVDPDDAAVLWGSEPDYTNAHELATWASGGDGDEAAAYVGWLKCRAERIIWSPVWWEGIEYLAKQLLVTPTMSGRKVRTVIQEGLTSHMVVRGVFRLTEPPAT